MGMFSDIDYSLIVLQLEKAMANGVATLDSNTKVPKAQISLTASDVGAIASTGNEVLTSLNAASGTISSGLLPSYVDDVLNYTNLAGFPGTGETGKIYVDETTNKVYRWSGSVYVEISSSATAGEALKLTTPRTITTTGDASYSVSFDGSANVTSAITLATVNSNAGSFGSASSIPAITVNAKGQVTAVSTNSIGNELIAIQALSDTPGFLKKTGNGIYSIDINSYLSLAGGTITGDLISTSATASTSTTTGALRVASLGVTGAIFAGTVSANSYDLIPIGRGGGGVSSNTSTGVNALLSNTTGGFSSAFGVRALQSNTTGEYSSAFGANALLNNTTGSGLSAFGAGALHANTTGGSLSAFGAGALHANTTGWNSSAFGDNAGRYISDGSTSLTITNNSCFFGMNTKGTQNATNENVFGFNATGNGSNTVTIGDFNITNTYLRGVISTNSTTPSTSPTTGASIIPGGQGIGGNQYIGGFSSLGGDANHPGIKIKVLTGTTAATQGGAVSIAHGIADISKIISVNLWVNTIQGLGLFAPPNYTNGGIQYNFMLYGGHISVENHPSNSYSLLSKPVTITIIYTA
jgi:hypothetical protein